MVFRNLRERFCIDDQDYQVDANWLIIKKTKDFEAKGLRFARAVFLLLTEIVPPSAQNSLTRSAPLNSDSQGRFGNRFLTTYDRRFVIKTVSSEDIAEMHNILKKYHQVGALQQHGQGCIRCHPQPHIPLLPLFLLTFSALLPRLSVVYCGVPWQHAAATVPGHVQANSGRGGDIHGGDPECI